MAPTLRRNNHNNNNTACTTSNDQNAVPTMKTNGKRKADASPIRHDKAKRSALGNLTNAAPVNHHADGKNATKPSAAMARKKVVAKKKTENISFIKNSLRTMAAPAATTTDYAAVLDLPRPTKVQTRASIRGIADATIIKPVNVTKPLQTRRISNEFDESKSADFIGKKSTEGRIVVLAAPPPPQKESKAMPTRRISNEFEKTGDDTLYISW